VLTFVATEHQRPTFDMRNGENSSRQSLTLYMGTSKPSNWKYMTLNTYVKNHIFATIQSNLMKHLVDELS